MSRVFYRNFVLFFLQLHRTPVQRWIQNPVKYLRWNFSCKNSERLKAANYSRKKLHLRCLTGFWSRLCTGAKLLHIHTEHDEGSNNWVHLPLHGERKSLEISSLDLSFNVCANKFLFNNSCVRSCQFFLYSLIPLSASPGLNFVDNTVSSKLESNISSFMFTSIVFFYFSIQYTFLQSYKRH